MFNCEEYVNSTFPSLRFPLFGGWKTHYFIGYNVPSYEYLFSSGEKFALSMRLVDHIFDDMLVEDMTLKVILPEGAKVRYHLAGIQMERRWGVLPKVLPLLLFGIQ